MDKLRAYLREYGRMSHLARQLRVTPGAICQWNTTRIPAERVLQVEGITGISRHDLRPDLYPRVPVEPPPGDGQAGD